MNREIDQRIDQLESLIDTLQQELKKNNVKTDDFQDKIEDCQDMIEMIRIS